MLVIFLCALAPAVLMLFDLDMSMDSLRSIVGLLVGISGAVFTIMSIWLAFLYPNVLNTLRGRNISSADFSAAGGDTERLKVIVVVIVKSAIAMIYALLVSLVFGFYGSLSFDAQRWTSSSIQFLSVFFVFLQISAILSLIIINFHFVHLLEKNAKKKARDLDI